MSTFLLAIVVNESKDLVLFYATIIILISIASIIFIILIRSIFKKPSITLLDELNMQKLENYFLKENNRYYNERNLSWKLGEHYFWVELHLQKI